jgi:oligoendopeptidase F
MKLSSHTTAFPFPPPEAGSRPLSEILDPPYQWLAATFPKAPSALPSWLSHWDQWRGQLYDVQAWRYFRYLGHLNDEQAREAYMTFAQQWEKQIEKQEAQLAALLPASFPQQTQLPQLSRWLDRIHAQQPIRSAKVREIQQQLQAHLGQHPRRFAAVQIPFEGKVLSPQEAGGLMGQLDRKKRQGLWKAVNASRRAQWDDFHQLFEQQLSLRHQLAQASGFASYSSYRMLELGKTAYGAGLRADFQQALAEALPPRLARLHQWQCQQAGWKALMPWDLSAGTELPAFPKREEILDGLEGWLQQVSPLLLEALQQLRKGGRLDLEARAGKAGGGFSLPIRKDGLPLVFANYSPTFEGFRNLLHELGHGLHFFLSRHQPYASLLPITPEVGELAALSFELMAMEGLAHSFPQPHLLLQKQLHRIFHLLPLTATLDHFQEQVYRFPQQTRRERNRSWSQSYRLFHGESICWEDHEEEMENLWLRYGHLFEVPFYSLEYSFAQLGALAVWQNYRKAPEQAIQQLHSMLTAGNSLSIKESYERVGADFPLHPAEIARLLDRCLEAFPG